MAKVTDTVRIGKLEVALTCEDKFGVTPHFGVSYTDQNNNYKTGWIPVAILNELEQNGHAINIDQPVSFMAAKKQFVGGR